jgi:hypothetical protein
MSPAGRNDSFAKLYEGAAAAATGDSGIGGGSAGLGSTEAQILMLSEQPSRYGRFRYQAEGRQNCLGGRTEGQFPTVVINPSYRGVIPDGTVVQVSLVTRQNGPNGELT